MSGLSQERTLALHKTARGFMHGSQRQVTMKIEASLRDIVGPWEQQLRPYSSRFAHGYPRMRG